VELLQLDAKSIRVSEYLTELPPLPLLRARLHKAIEHAREQAARTLKDTSKDPGVEKPRLEEARRRYDAYRRGEMPSVPGDEAMSRARSRLK
jgi:hypothetical protein